MNSSPAAPERLTDPESGEPGLRVRFLDADRAPVATEHRNSGKLIWMGSFGSEVPVEAVGFVEVRGLLRATETGAYRVGVSGVGHFALAVDERPVIDGVLELPGGKEPIEAMVRPPQRTAEVQLSVGQEVEVVLTHRVEADPIGTTFTLGLEPPALPEGDELAHAAELAASADVAVVMLGTSGESEGFDRDSLALPGRQDELVRRVVAANPNTAVVVNSGAPVLLPRAEGIRCRTPCRWTGALYYADQVHIGHRAFERSDVEPAFWFGHGLGYITWEYEDAEVTEGAGVIVWIRLRNTGQRPSREVVQVYLRRDGEVERPKHWLAGFATVEAAPGESVEVAVRGPARAFQHWRNGTWQAEHERFTLRIGRSLAELPIATEVTVKPRWRAEGVRTGRY